MVALSKRMAKLRTRLLNIRIGPGAIILPPSLSRIHLTFAPKLNLGHLGPRKFAQHYLPRLKYHNPAVPMTVDRTAPQDGPATMTVTFAEPISSGDDAAASPAPAAATGSTTTPQTSSAPVTPTETPDVPLETRIETIEMKGQHESEILRRLVALTNATEVRATGEEEEELARLEKRREFAEGDRVREGERREGVKRREAILKGAKEAQA